jgi:hypothetical protein
MGEPDRLARCSAVAAKLSSLSDKGIRSLLDAGTQPRVGIGGTTHSIEVAGSPVFVKAIKLSTLEVDAGPGDTRNLFGLPPWYHYGVGEGSTGFNAWREVATHERVSDWVIRDNGGAFPLLYHRRIVPNVAPRELGEADISRALKFWAGSAEVEARLRALSASTTVVAVFTEHVPLVLRGWLDSQLASGRMGMVGAVQRVLDQLLAAATQMRAHGVVHFDAHLDNVLTTGHQLVVSDFGLAVAANFQLDDAERQFLTTHTDHDVAYCAAELTNAILRKVMDFRDARARNDWLQMCSQNGTPDGIPSPFAETIRRLAPTASLINDFYWHLHDGHFQTEFPSTALAATLNAIGQSGSLKVTAVEQSEIVSCPHSS